MRRSHSRVSNAGPGACRHLSGAAVCLDAFDGEKLKHVSKAFTWLGEHLAHAADEIVVSKIESWQAVFGGKQITVPV